MSNGAVAATSFEAESQPRERCAPQTWDQILQHHGSEIERRVSADRAISGLVDDMLDYHLSAGGKRMRALLPVWVCVNLGGRPEDAFDLGAGLELLHNATLVHDDLQDGDTERRGRPTVWARWGAAQAINAGDALIFEGFARMMRAPSAPRLLGAISAALVRVVEGQSMEFQLQLPRGADGALEPTRSNWERMARGKTGALFGACMLAGAAAAGAAEAAAEQAAQYGEDVGLLFQMQDDYLDLVGGKGRRRGSDLLEGKRSFPVIWALENAGASHTTPIRALLARPREERTWSMADEALDALSRSGALAATAAHLLEAERAAEEHPMAAVVPSWAARCLAPVARALGESARGGADRRSRAGGIQS